jgi:multicomponent Na+:H+ antiporter subunit E
MLALNLFLSLTWVAVTGESTPTNFLFGFLLGYLLLWAARDMLGCAGYVRKVWKFVGFLLYVAGEIVLASLRVVYDVLTPRHYMRPGILTVPLEAKSDAEIFMLAGLVTLTPGSLSLDVSADRKVLYVYEMYLSDPEKSRERIKNGMERRLLELMR